MKRTLIILVVASFCLISLGVFYKFLIEPIYIRHELSSCLSKVDNKFNDTRDNACKSYKESNLNYCLRDAQSKIYCKDESHRTYNKSTGTGSGSGFLGSLIVNSYTCNAPDNSNGYWNDNSEYQQSVTQCEQKVAGESCRLSDDYTQSLIDSRERERNFCLKQF